MLANQVRMTRYLVGFSLTFVALSGCNGSSDPPNPSPGSGGAATGGTRATTTTTTVATGGSVAAGGSTATSATGGAPATTATQAKGGSTAAGGTTGSSTTAQPTGGKSSTTATSATGGSPANGGTKSASGGEQPKGGSTATGGVQNNAGGPNKPTGGTTATSGGSNSSAGAPPVGSCPTPALKPTAGTKKITVGGLDREYILHVPSAYTGSTPVPLILDFHPIGGSDTAWAATSGGSPYPAVVDKEGVISAFPNGLKGPLGNAWNVQGCCVSKVNGADVDDVAFAKAIVAEIQKSACIDPKRIYAVGFSMGGGMSNYLACHAADVFAAAGPAAFDLTKQNVDGCKPQRPITVIEWRGKNDSVVTYAGGHSEAVSGMAIDFLGAVGTFQKWAELDGCTGNPSAADSNGCQTYSQCSAGVQVTLCTAASGGHEAANASVVWPMLKKYSLP